MFDMQIVGRVHALARVALEKAAKTAAPDFLWHNVDFSRLGRVHDTTDLDAIDRQGAMRAAAEALAREAADPQTSAEARTAAEDALSELFSYVLED